MNQSKGHLKALKPDQNNNLVRGNPTADVRERKRGARREREVMVRYKSQARKVKTHYQSNLRSGSDQDIKMNETKNHSDMMPPGLEENFRKGKVNLS